MRLFHSFLILCIILIMHIKEEPYEIFISRTVLERRFFESNDDRNGWLLNPKEAEALQNYYEAMRLEIDPYDRSYILYNIGLIHTSNGEHTKALEYYFRALERNPFLPQAFNNMAVICHYVRLSPL